MTALAEEPMILDLAPPLADFRAETLAGLAGRPKSLPSKFFYDEAGSKLFERICNLPEYYLTRTELAILRQHARDIARCVGPNVEVIEYGSGSGIKTRLLLRALEDPAGYWPIEISEAALRHSCSRLRQEFPSLHLRPVLADFSQPVDLPLASQSGRARLVFFPGSTLGNFSPGDARQLLASTSRLVGPGGFLVLGADRRKHPARLHAAYNDAAGVTAEFNLNLLRRINRELDADFQVERFAHYAFFEPRHGRIEMHLVSLADQVVEVAGEAIPFAAGESIRTEYSHKYTLQDLEALADSAGFHIQASWTDPAGDFFVQVWQTRVPRSE